MSKVGIVTDTISCLPQELINEYDIKVVPVGFTIDDKTFMDNEITAEDFWKLFKAAKNLPTTHAANPASFANVYREHAKTRDSILCILVSHKLSATHEAAVQAKDMIKEVTGLIRGNGFEPKIKPESFVASTVADRFS